MFFYNINIMRPTTLFFSIAVALTAMPLHSQDFDKHFADSTLRLDYIFGGKAGPDAGCTLLLDCASREPRLGRTPPQPFGCAASRQRTHRHDRRRDG